MSKEDLPYGFKVKQKIIALIPTFDIYDEATGNQVFKARKTFLSLTPNIKIYNMQGVKVIEIKANFFFANKWKIYQDGKLIGTVKFPIFRLCGIKFDVELLGNIYTAADILGWSFKAVDVNNRIGFTLDKKVFSLRDTYKITVYPPLEPIFGIAA
ncbi:MAG: LURP-one-related/scramblase family protein, partial [Candidatus Heimdallarchaeaceae archaeon]